MSKPIIVAIDETQLSSFKQTVDSLDSSLCMIKVGSVSFNAIGHEALTYVASKGFEIFLDLKLHDIPNTVKKSIEGTNLIANRHDDYSYFWWSRDDESCKESSFRH
jgi:orotidine-5'-phosphate decarboxylase